MIREFTDVKQLKEGTSLVQSKKTGKMGTVVKILVAENRFTVRYITDDAMEGFCEPKDFYLVIPTVKGTVPRGSME